MYRPANHNFRAMEYHPFGMILSGRSWEVGSGYRYGFNTQEQDDEVYGNGNSIDFGERIYDSRLSRWFSTDPLSAKFPSWSPYAFAMLSPISNVDYKGNENVIYLAVLPSAYTSLSKTDIENIINLANLNFQALGVKTRVVLATEACGCDMSAFDPNKIDATDGIAVIGDAQKVKDFIDSFGPNSMKWDDFTAPSDISNPETSENKGKDGKGKWIAIDASDIPHLVERLVTDDTKEHKKAQLGSLFINHGTGHLAGMQHTGSENVDGLWTTPAIPGFTFSFIMQTGEGLINDINNPNIGYTALTSDYRDDLVKIIYYDDPYATYEERKVVVTTRNSDYDTYLKNRFGDKESKINYPKK